MPSRSRNQLPPRYPASAVRVPATNSVEVSTAALAASTAPRRGVAASVARIIPVPYSLVTTSAPRTTAVTCANIIPHVTKAPTGSPTSPRASASALSAHTSVVSPAPSTNRSEEHTSELHSRQHLACRLLLEK